MLRSGRNLGDRKYHSPKIGYVTVTRSHRSRESSLEMSTLCYEMEEVLTERIEERTLIDPMSVLEK